MPAHLLIRLLVFVCLLAGQRVLAQQTPNVRISGNYDSQPLASVLQSVEAQAAAQGFPLRIFYDTALVAGVKVNLQLEREPLPQAMDKILAETPAGFVPHETYYFVLLRKADALDFAPAAAPDSAASGPAAQATPPTETIENPTENLRQTAGLQQRRGTKAFTLGGVLKDATKGSGLAGATVFVEEMRSGVATDNNGAYTLNLPAGVYNLVFSYVGYQSKRRQIVLRGNQALNVDLVNADIRLREVVVTGEAANRNVSTTQMSISKLSIRTIRKIPPLLGEVDVVRSILLLPGVSTVGEGATGFNVRGGGIDQNLVLMDNAPIYNSSHLFGLFSVFNPDIVKDVTLHRGGISARFGGRASSVLDIQLKDANAQKLRFTGGIGLVSSRLSVEAPIIKDKLSFIIAGRGSFTDFLLRSLPNKSLQNTRANFYDLNVKADYRINPKNLVSVSGYVSDDFLQISADSVLTLAVNSSKTQYRWSNRYATVKWQHTFSDKLTQNTSLIYNDYTAKVINPEAPNRFEIPAQLAQQNLSTDFGYLLNDKHKLAFGLQAIRYQVRPESLNPVPPSDVNAVNLPKEQGWEAAAYVEDEFTISNTLTLTAGLRYSTYASTGPATVYEYGTETDRNPLNVTDSTVYGSGAAIRQYGGFEPRAALKISLSESSSLKVSYNRMRQYIHLISNTSAAIPTARWKLSDTYIRPQIADQVALGYFRNFTGNMFETSVEVYYKKTANFLDYKDNAVVFLNRSIETAVLQGAGRSYGVELLARKNIGEYLTGWLSYTYARTFVQMQSSLPTERVNNGDWYPANYDKPHTVNAVVNYQFKKRSGVSLNYTYSTGRPITYPEGKFTFDGIAVPDFGLRNQFRIPDYHRLDVAWTIDSGYRKRKKVDKSWTVAIYNLYSRNNAYSVFFRANGGRAEAYKLSIFGAAFPSLTYNFKF